MNLKGVIQNFKIYIVGGIFSKLFSLVALPFMTSKLNPEEFGNLDLILLFGSLFHLILNFGMDSSLSYFFINGKEIRHSKKDTVSTIFFLNLLIGIILILIFPKLIKLINHNISYEILSLVCLIFFFEHYIRQGLNIFRLSKLSKKYVINELIFSLLLNTMTITVLLTTDMKIMAIIYSRLLSALLIFCVVMFQLKDLLSINAVIWKSFNAIFLFAIPIFPQAFGAYLFTFTDRYLINQLIGSDQLGVFSATLKLTVIFVFFANIFRLTILPDLLELVRDNNKKTIKDLINFYFFTIHFLTIFSTLFALPLVNLLIGERYNSIHYLFGLMLIYPLYAAGFNIVSIGLWKTKKNLYGTLILILMGILNLFLTYLMIHYFKIDGAVLSSAIISVFWILTTLIVSNRFYKLEISLKKQILSFLMFISIMVFLSQLYKLEITFSFYLIVFSIISIYTFLEIKLRSINFNKILKNGFKL